MESKKDKIVEEKENFESDWIAAMILASGLFGDWSKHAKYDELEKRISELETKNQIFEKILF